MDPASIKDALKRAYSESAVHRATFVVVHKLFGSSKQTSLVRDAAAYWSESSSDSQRQELAHWRGRGRWTDEKRWLALGQEHRAMIEQFLATRGRELRNATVVEWGPGGGSNVLALLPEVQRIYGVDVSQSSLDECMRQVGGEYPDRFVPVLLEHLDPESVLGKVAGPVDLFYSTAVFQHFPSKEYGERVLRAMTRLMPTGACAMVQIRYDDGRVKYLPKARSYRKNAVTFTSYSLSEFWKLLVSTGFEPAYLSLRVANNYGYFFFTRV